MPKAASAGNPLRTSPTVVSTTTRTRRQMRAVDHDDSGRSRARRDSTRAGAVRGRPIGPVGRPLAVGLSCDLLAEQVCRVPGRFARSAQLRRMWASVRTNEDSQTRHSSLAFVQASVTSVATPMTADGQASPVDITPPSTPPPAAPAMTPGVTPSASRRPRLSTSPTTALDESSGAR
jgi:hypothetical protein